jgi:hypothetical protein
MSPCILQHLRIVSHIKTERLDRVRSPVNLYGERDGIAHFALLAVEEESLRQNGGEAQHEQAGKNKREPHQPRAACHKYTGH